MKARNLCGKHIGKMLYEHGYLKGRATEGRVLQWWEISMVTHGRNGLVKVRTADNGHRDYTYHADDKVLVEGEG